METIKGMVIFPVEVHKW